MFFYHNAIIFTQLLFLTYFIISYYSYKLCYNFFKIYCINKYYYYESSISYFFQIILIVTNKFLNTINYSLLLFML